MGLDPQPQGGQLEGLVVGEDPSSPLGLGQLDPEVLAVGPLDDGLALGPHPDVEKPRALLVDDVGVGLDLTAHDHLTLADGRLDDYVVGVPGRGVDGEHDPGTLGGDHLLDDHRQGRLVGDALGGPVRDRT